MPPLSEEQQAALARAAHWFSRLHSEDLSATERQHWQAWHDGSPLNAWAWQQAERLQQRLSGAPLQAGRTLALAGERRTTERRSLLKGIALLLGTGGLGWGGYRQGSFDAWLSDLHTASGERLSHSLPDGSQLHLNSASTVDVRYDSQQRLLELRRGEIMLASATDPAGRPLRVRTAQGTVRALGTRFSVRCLDDGQTRVAVHQHSVEITPSDGQPVRLESGNQAIFDRSGILRQTAVVPGQDAWQQNQLIVNDWRLDDFITELARHRRGWLRCAPAVAQLRISGTFDLRDTEQILRALASSLPVRIERRTDYWISVVGR
ncbi:FecR domain-containing protein [Pseudomonas sp. ABC1]|uniref:FecR domain-containing protein n=1 Tax=Pseudomonas sp. ABC1 TaxID=2748080 RepID=UPI0015C38BFA|nr:FecR domain-containing protein [Pseudomonas sp. ABC1]QLF91967.1 FecR domain-containing protein [Pseudomonas sp. ABC1]